MRVRKEVNAPVRNEFRCSEDFQFEKPEEYNHKRTKSATASQFTCKLKTYSCHQQSRRICKTWHFKEILSIGLNNVGNDCIKKFISLTEGLSHELAISYVGFKVWHVFIAFKVLPAVRVKQELILTVLFTLFFLKQNVSCFSLLVCRLPEDLLILGMAVAF